jgi:hypothetical protein
MSTPSKKIVITAVLEGPGINSLNAEIVAERVHRAIYGEDLDKIAAKEGLEYRSCDGIDLGGYVCIGESRN